MKAGRRLEKPLFEVRNSRVHGHGVFALRRIRKGTSIVEYLGDRVSHDEANSRYEDKDPRDGHTFLFTVDAKTVIDAGIDGNEARFINHGCDPNCQAVDIGKRLPLRRAELPRQHARGTQEKIARQEEIASQETGPPQEGELEGEAQSGAQAPAVSVAADLGSQGVSVQEQFVSPAEASRLRECADLRESRGDFTARSACTRLTGSAKSALSRRVMPSTRSDRQWAKS